MKAGERLKKTAGEAAETKVRHFAFATHLQLAAGHAY